MWVTGNVGIYKNEVADELPKKKVFWRAFLMPPSTAQVAEPLNKNSKRKLLSMFYTSVANLRKKYLWHFIKMQQDRISQDDAEPQLSGLLWKSRSFLEKTGLIPFTCKIHKYHNYFYLYFYCGKFTRKICKN